MKARSSVVSSARPSTNRSISKLLLRLGGGYLLFLPKEPPWLVCLAPRSKIELERELRVPGWRCLCCDLAERNWSRQRAARRPETHVIEEVEELRSEIEVSLLRYAEPFADGAVQIKEGRAILGRDGCVAK
jgi:hypothetical protein